ncbi:EthD family reductase [Salipiger sp. P9]|uniref:EthD family reductase n=1 Tax=Salipiger pentaromativorans TaxID=2943193 RepID=UPI002157783C|nr:EthD family reductase [Salipiger pentaromativorans]MCR8550634.1 EthD family reductase [Salipiger pentaromativorans]
MIQRLSCLQRRADISRPQFSQHWRDIHAPLAAKVPGLLRYQQNHVIDTSQMVKHTRGGSEVDGFAQLWFADEAAMKEASSTPEYRAAFGDLPEFTGAMSQYAVETNPVMEKSLTGKGVKRMTLLYGKEGMSEKDFRFHWFDEHAAMVMEFPGLRGYLQHLIVANLPLPAGPVTDAGIHCTGILEMWFDDKESMEAAFASPQAKSTVAHGDVFLRAATTYMVEEIEVI